jgi:hypothetical protein
MNMPLRWAQVPVPIFMKFGSGIQKLIGGGDTQAYKEDEIA